MSNALRGLVLKHHLPQRKYTMSALPFFSPSSKANEAMNLPGITDAPGHCCLENVSKLGAHSHPPS